MKRFSKLMSLLLFAAVTQYSCINDADVVIADDTHSESNGNLALFFEIPNVATSRSAESSGVTTEGSKEEYAVKSLTVYLFDSTTKTLKDQQELKPHHENTYPPAYIPPHKTAAKRKPMRNTDTPFGGRLHLCDHIRKYSPN